MNTPKITPAEAIAIALTVTPTGGRLVTNEAPVVKQVLDALRLAGYDIVPRASTDDERAA